MGSKNKILILIVGESVHKLHRFIGKILDDRFECFMLPDEYHDSPLSPVKLACILDKINKQPNLILYNTKSKDGFDHDTFKLISFGLYISHIPKLVITNNKAHGESCVERHNSIHDYIIKPFDKADLTSRIDKLTASLKLLQFQFFMMLDSDENINHPLKISLSAEDHVFLKDFKSSLKEYNNHKLDEFGVVEQIIKKTNLSINMIRYKIYALLGEHLSEFIVKHKLEFLFDCNITELAQKHLINQRQTEVNKLSKEPENLITKELKEKYKTKHQIH